MPYKKDPDKLSAQEHLLVEYIVAHPESSEMQAAIACGWSEGGSHKALNRPRVRKAIEAALAKKTAAVQTHSIKKAIVTRSIIEERALELALLSPADTKDTITGQVNALRLLSELGGHIVQQTKDLTEEFKGKSEADMEFFATHGYWPGTVDAGKPGTFETAGEGAVHAQSEKKPH